MAEGTKHELARHMGIAALVVYGVGDMLGTGIYALIGKAAGTMGNAVWAAFLMSMLGAVLTGLSYASLGSRHPKAAGAAYVAQRAFGIPMLSYVVGLATVASGLTSAATGARAFLGYLAGMTGWAIPQSGGDLREISAPVWILLAVLYVGLLTIINLRGIRESTWTNILCTSVEAAGLIVIICFGLRYLGGVDFFEVPAQGDAGTAQLGPLLLLQGGVLAFYAFIGFEDMINVTEEVKNPERNFPVALVIAVSIVAAIYIVISLIAVSVVPWQELSKSDQPLVEVARKVAPWFPPHAYSAIALFAIFNTGLLNFIMGSRVVYGMSRQGLLPQSLGKVHPRRRTPHIAILVLSAIILILFFSGDIRQLATATSVLLLLVFIAVNGSLIVLKRRAGEAHGKFEVPLVVPIAGILVCLAMLTQATSRAMLIACAILAGIVLLFFVSRNAKALPVPDDRA